MRNQKLTILTFVAVAFSFFILLNVLLNASSSAVRVQAGPDQSIRGFSVRLQGFVSNQQPLNFWTADGDHATEDMLVKYDSRSGIVYAGPLTNGEGIRFGWPSDFARIQNHVYGIDAYRRHLYKLNGETGKCEPLETRMRHQRVFGLAYAKAQDRLYAVDQVSRNLLLLNTRTGKATEVVTLPASHHDIRGIAYNAKDDHLYYSDEATESIYRCHPTKGNSKLLMALPDGPNARIEELEFYDGRLFASYLTLRDSIWSMQIMEIDTNLRATHLIGPVIKDLSAHCLLVNSMPERVLWRQISGPAKAEFSDVSDPNATVKFTHPGAYVLELGTDQITDSVTISVFAP